jgi:hypothetical protein
MLRQALDEANSRSATETDSLIADTQEPSYSTHNNDDDSDGSESGSYEDDDYIIRGWQDGIAAVPEVGLLEKAWRVIKGCFVVVVNVENVWDSPNLNRPEGVSRRDRYVVLFWFFILATSYATERSTFKLLVDRTGPFRLIAVEMLTFTHALMLGLGMFISAVSRKDFSIAPLGIPIVDVGRKCHKMFFFGYISSYTGTTSDKLLFHLIHSNGTS